MIDSSSRLKTGEGETLRKFWNDLNGLAANCNFGYIAEGLAKDVFFVIMVNKEVQQKLCTELKGTVQETIQLAIDYEEEAIRQQSFDKREKPNIKTGTSEVNSINKGAKRCVPSKN